MAQITHDELKEINDNFQILLRLIYMTRFLPGAKEDPLYTLNHTGNDIYCQFTRLGLQVVNCDCRGNLNSNIVTQGLLVRERGYRFECAQCGRIYTYDTDSRFARVVDMPHRPFKVAIPVGISSWVKSIQGIWNPVTLTVDNVELVTLNGVGAFAEKIGSYTHRPIPYDLWIKWVEASSKGSFWHHNIKEYILGDHPWQRR